MFWFFFRFAHFCIYKMVCIHDFVPLYFAVIDLTTSAPRLLRRGAGDASMWAGVILHLTPPHPTPPHPTPRRVLSITVKKLVSLCLKPLSPVLLSDRTKHVCTACVPRVYRVCTYLS